MGLMNKLKNMFTEEIEDTDTVPIKKEVIQVEIPAPAKRDIDTAEKETWEQKDEKKEVISTRVKEKEDIAPSKKDDKFTFPVFFDDKDFDVIEKKEEPKPEKKAKPYQGSAIEIPRESKKIFKPTPVISPVYGVLDKNYKKEDIVSKEDYSSSSDKGISIDDIRKKAYGTLEDDLENGLLHDSVYDKPAAFREETDMFEDLGILTGDDYFTDLPEPEEEIKKTRMGTKNKEKEENMVASELNQMVKEESEEEKKDDLFDLIDSMYEKGDES